MTLYLANFDLKVDEDEDENDDEHGGATMGLNRTRLDSFLDAISLIDIGNILASAGTTAKYHLTLSSLSSSSSSTSPDEAAPPLRRERRLRHAARGR